MVLAAKEGLDEVMKDVRLVEDAMLRKVVLEGVACIFLWKKLNK